MPPPLTPAEIATALPTLVGWAVEGDALAKTFTFSTFREAMSFMVRVGFEAEAADHHPGWTNIYNRVAIRLNTHDAGGKITAKDVALARKIQAISWVGWGCTGWFISFAMGSISRRSGRSSALCVRILADHSIRGA